MVALVYLHSCLYAILTPALQRGKEEGQEDEGCEARFVVGACYAKP